MAYNLKMESGGSISSKKKKNRMCHKGTHMANEIRKSMQDMKEELDKELEIQKKNQTEILKNVL